MSSGDAGIPIEGGQTPIERDLSKELAQASEVGRMVLGVTRERNEDPRFRVRKYAMPMLDPRGFSQEAIRAITSKKEQITDDEIRAAREASVALAVESTAQIVEARPTSNQVSEDSDSLREMARMVNRGAGLVIQTEVSDMEAVVKAGRVAIEKRKGAKGLEEADTWDDQKVLAWEKEMFGKAGSRLGNMIRAIDAYSGR